MTQHLSPATINAALDKSMSYALMVRRLADTVAAGGTAADALATCTDLPHPDVRAAAACAHHRVLAGMSLPQALDHPNVPQTLPMFLAAGERTDQVDTYLARAAAILTDSAEQTLSDAMDLIDHIPDTDDRTTP